MLHVFAYEVVLSSLFGTYGLGCQIVIIRLRDGRLSIRGVGQLLPDGSTFLTAAEVLPEEEVLMFHHEQDCSWWEKAQFSNWESGDLVLDDEIVRFVKS